MDSAYSECSVSVASGLHRRSGFSHPVHRDSVHVGSLSSCENKGRLSILYPKITYLGRQYRHFPRTTHTPAPSSAHAWGPLCTPLAQEQDETEGPISSTIFHLSVFSLGPVLRKPQIIPRTNICEHMLWSRCCASMVSALSITPGTELLPDTQSHTVEWGRLSESLSEHPAFGLLNSPGLTLHLGPRFSTLLESRAVFLRLGQLLAKPQKNAQRGPNCQANSQGLYRPPSSFSSPSQPLEPVDRPPSQEPGITHLGYMMGGPVPSFLDNARKLPSHCSACCCASRPPS